jgi:hypothetical protein
LDFPHEPWITPIVTLDFPRNLREYPRNPHECPWNIPKES